MAAGSFMPGTEPTEAATASVTCDSTGHSMQSASFSDTSAVFDCRPVHWVLLNDQQRRSALP